MSFTGYFLMSAIPVNILLKFSLKSLFGKLMALCALICSWIHSERPRMQKLKQALDSLLRFGLSLFVCLLIFETRSRHVIQALITLLSPGSQVCPPHPAPQQCCKSSCVCLLSIETLACTFLEFLNL